MTTTAPVAPVAVRTLLRVLGVEHLFTSLGLYSLLPVLGLLLATAGQGPGLVGFGLFCYTTSAGVSALLANRWLGRLRYVTGMGASVLLPATAFGLLSYVRAGWALCLLLVLAGLGVSVHFVLSRVLVAEVLPDDVGRHRVYSLLQIAVNAAAAVGPFIASFLDARVLPALVSLAYLAAGVCLVAGVPRELRAPATTGRYPISRATLGRALRDPGQRRILLISTIGTFVYAQFFSAFALYVAHAFREAPIRGALLAGPAIAIVIFQVVVTRVVERFLRGGVRPVRILGAATVLFGLAMLVLGLNLPALFGAASAVLVFSAAEMVFTPMVSTAFAGLPIGSSLEAFNLRQVCWTAGEGLGSLAGGSLFLVLYLGGSGWLYWSVLGVLTLAATAALVTSPRPAVTSA